jgi:hypothetical protein
MPPSEITRTTAIARRQIHDMIIRRSNLWRLGACHLLDFGWDNMRAGRRVGSEDKYRLKKNSWLARRMFGEDLGRRLVLYI